ncbi:chromosomal replication initiator protein DnaA [bacterium]|nr:chromosomal replication initiator protein DnaA [bacterium]
MVETYAGEILKQVREELKRAIPSPKFELLILPLRIAEISGNTVTLLATGDKHIEWLRDEFWSELTRAFSLALGGSAELNLVVDPSAGEKRTANADAAQPLLQALPRASRAVARPLLNPRFTFENFVVGSSNQFCASAAKAVAERPGYAYNPLFIYSDVGLGKTHLLHAIGHRVMEAYPDYRVIYVTSEKFTSDFIEKVRTGRMNEFHQRYRQCDLLLIDDIQFIANKVETQMEFFHTFMTLVDGGKQIAISSDSPPQDLKNIESRLLSRFGSGLLVDLEPPAVETRMAILAKKAELEGISISPEVSAFIAESVPTNIRELEGALIRLLAFCDFSGTKPTLEIARRVLSDFVKGQHGRRFLSMEQIIEAVCEVFRVSPNLIMGRDRRKKLAEARMIIMYLGRENTNLTLAQIGEEVGGRDHSTVSHGVRKIAQAMDEDPYLKQMVQQVIRKLS